MKPFGEMGDDVAMERERAPIADGWANQVERPAIGERRTPGRQRQNVPPGSRTHLVEFGDTRVGKAG